MYLGHVGGPRLTNEELSTVHTSIFSGSNDHKVVSKELVEKTRSPCFNAPLGGVVYFSQYLERKSKIGKAVSSIE